MTLDLSEFVDFGKILNREGRKRLVDYLKKKIRREEIDPSYYADLSKYTRQIDSIFSDPVVLDTVSEHPAIEDQVTSEMLELFQRTNKEFMVNNPYQEEENDLSDWSSKNHEQVLEGIAQLFSNIRKFYSEIELQLDFYEKTAKNENKVLRKDRHKLGALVESILGDWKRHLFEKELRFELDIIEAKRAEFCKLLYEQIDKFRKLKELLSPFTNELGRLWDLSSGVWQRTNLDILAKYAEFLESEKSVKELAEMLGRMSSSERELQEEQRVEKVFETEWKANHASKAELVGIYESDDLNSLLPSEVVLLSEKTTEPHFFKKFAEKKLMSWEYEARILAQKEAVAKHKILAPKKAEKGPVIICVDTSASMHGEPETIAKAVAFAILRVALRDKRACYLISFSTDMQTINLNDLRESLTKLIDFLTMSFYGGTDPEPALREALSQMKKGQYKDADLLVVSDFIMSDLSKETVHEIEEAKKMKNRFHSLAISPSANEKVLDIFDNNWFYDLSGPSRIRELVISVRSITS